MTKLTIKNTKKIILSSVLIAVFGGSLVACGNKSNDTPPKPLVEFKSSLDAKYTWDTNIGNGNDGQIDLTLTPAIKNGVVYTSSYDGYISAVNATGKRLWSTNTKLQLSSPVTVSGHTAIAGSLRGTLVAVDTSSGKVLWQSALPSSLFSAPTIVDNVIYTQTHDGSISAYKLKDGKQLWTQSIAIPDLMLVGNSSPVVYQGLVIAGTSSGSLWGLKTATGEKQWDNPIALPQSGSPAQQMVDITATPIIDNDTLYVATFQGNLISFNTKLGSMNWQKKASIYRSMALGQKAIFTTDTKGDLIAYNLKTGNKLWQATELEGRKPSAPVYINGMVAVGDYKGYVHIFNAETGKYLTRVEIGGDGISATPIAAGKSIIVQTNSGKLAAIHL
ncbi:outer membrane protein assembly factor BamB [Cysteiniphilum halobium]|uniref:outer membrane protein assembly factor BamB n=1 Tax=Cysteiniphilum halobium TaxID=2219059 RepID=UPI0013C3759C|nr:outer membrane protein assembly factor BamB [Cysteiniphilum halobium]